jgi:hypothetical protein
LAKSGIVWYYDTLTPNLLRFNIEFSAYVAGLTKGFAAQVENYAQQNARWQDRTGQARRGLTATGSSSITKYTIDLFHTVDYGIWLEVRWSGRYAIIIPTIEVMGPRFMAFLEAAQPVSAAAV